MTPVIQAVVEDNNVCGEGPIWDADGGRLIWTDIGSSQFFQLDPARGQRTVLGSGRRVAGIALHTAGGLVLAGAAGVHIWHEPNDSKCVLVEHAGESLFFNDILADPEGRVYAGTLYWGPKGMVKTGKLYLLDLDGSVQVVADGIEMSNGLGLSPDNRTLYYADTAVRRIYAFDVDPATGALSNKRTFVQVPGDEGIPDGLTVDADGFIWSAQWFGARVVRYDSEGKVERRIKMPVKQVSSVAFGGPDLTDLYVTTAAEYEPSPLAPPGFDDKAPMGGSLYRIRLDIRGRAEYQARLTG